jgi:hypothetical protein
MPVRQQATHLAVCWRLDGDIEPMDHLMNLTNLIFMIILESTGKSLIFHGFGVDPNKLWITLLITALGPCARLDFQAFRWFAHQLSRRLNLNKNNDLDWGFRI